MSRRTIPAFIPGVTVVVGWDNPLSTFFAQVLRIQAPSDERDRVVFWIGGAPNEVGSVEDLAKRLAPYATIPTAMADHLLDDRAACAGHPPTPLQRFLLDRQAKRA